MLFAIKNRFTGSVIFNAEIEANEDTPLSIKLGLAVRVAVKANANLANANLANANLARANLTYANLTNANLADANLTNANLTGANLADANLTYANLTGANLADANLTNANLARANLTNANLRSFKADFWMILTQNRAEVPALIAALCDGRVDGSTYTGECACLVGTIAKVRGVDYQTLEYDATRPAERWFAMIREGDKPGDYSGGGFASRMAVRWALDWAAHNGLTPQPEWIAAAQDKIPEAA